MDVQGIRDRWDQWLSASSRTDMAHDKCKRLGGFTTRRMRDAKAQEAYDAWVATLAETDAAREAVAGDPDIDEVDAWEREQREIAEVAANQLTLF